MLADAPVKARFEARDADTVRVRTAEGEVAASIAVLTPHALLKYGWRKRWLTDERLWLDRWLRWLDGLPLEQLRPMLTGADQDLAALREDLDATFVPAPLVQGVTAALDRLQRTPLAEDGAAAWAELEAVAATLTEFGSHPLLTVRRQALVTLVETLAQRGFRLDNPAGLLLSGKVELRGGGVIRVTYEGNQHAAFDLVADHAYLDKLPRERTALARSEPPAIEVRRARHEIIGAGFFRWPLPLTGPLVIELDNSQAAEGQFKILLCDDREGSHLAASDTGLATVDLAQRVIDFQGSRSRTFYPDRSYLLRVEHDGVDKVVASLDGTVLATCTNPGSRVRGDVGVYVYSSNPITLHRLVVEGTIDPQALPALRARYVAHALRGLGR